MATYELAKTKIQYTLNFDDCIEWEGELGGELGRVLVGNINVQWHKPDTPARSASRIIYTWPAHATNCSRMVIYLPFDSQSSPGRCSAYLTTKDLGLKEVTDSDWIGPSSALNSDYIAKCADPYWDAACTQEINNGTWYGPGSQYPERKGIYFGFNLTQPMQAGATYYVYIIQEEGNVSGTGSACALYGTTSATATLTYEPVSGGVQLFINGAWKTHQAYRYNGTTWVPVVVYRYDGTTWRAMGQAQPSYTETPNEYGTTVVVNNYITETNNYGTTVIIE